MAVKCLRDGQEVRELRYAVISANTHLLRKKERDFYNHFVVIKALVTSKFELPSVFWTTLRGASYPQRKGPLKEIILKDLWTFRGKGVIYIMIMSKIPFMYQQKYRATHYRVCHLANSGKNLEYNSNLKFILASIMAKKRCSLCLKPMFQIFVPHLKVMGHPVLTAHYSEKRGLCFMK